MTLEELGRRAVACKRWRWMEGMLAGTTRIVDVKDGPYVFDSEYEDCAGLPHKAVPDLSDPATLGCLLALVREAWKGNVAPVYPDSDEALTKLVAALEAAP
jgi:hypothetical protein